MCLLFQRETNQRRVPRAIRAKEKSSVVENALDTNLCYGVDSTHAPAYHQDHQMHMDHRDTV